MSSIRPHRFDFVECRDFVLRAAVRRTPQRGRLFCQKKAKSSAERCGGHRNADVFFVKKRRRTSSSRKSGSTMIRTALRRTKFSAQRCTAGTKSSHVADGGRPLRGVLAEDSATQTAGSKVLVGSWRKPSSRRRSRPLLHYVDRVFWTCVDVVVRRNFVLAVHRFAEDKVPVDDVVVPTRLCHPHRFDFVECRDFVLRAAVRRTPQRGRLFCQKKAEDIRFSTTWMGSRHSTKSSAPLRGGQSPGTRQSRSGAKSFSTLVESI
jgi:hypothetical protein